MKYFILSLTVLLFAVSSCKKVTNPTSRENMLRNGKWQFASGTAEFKIPVSNKDTVEADTAYKPACLSDNYLVFGSNHDGNVNTGSNKCSPSEADTYPFYWEMVDNGNGIHIYNAETYFGTSTVEATISNFSSGSFTMKYMTTFTYPNPQDLSKDVIDTVHWTMTLKNF